MAASYLERESEFAREYEDFEADDVVKLIVATGDWLERLLFQPQAADAVMRTLYREVIGKGSDEEMEPHPETSWRSLWTDLSNSRQFDLETSQYLVSLNAFAYYGLRPDPSFIGVERDDPSDEVSLGRAIEACVAKGRALLDAVPSGWADIHDMTRTIWAAEARIRLDFGRDVTVEQLAALAKVTPKSVRNLIAQKGSEPNLSLNPSGEVPAAEALRWLQKRLDYKSSLWRETPESQDEPTRPTPEMEADLGEVIFVPVAKDGSWFDPRTCRNNRGFTVGSKGAEEAIDDYREALNRLARMPTPYWRRPNTAGNWGIVAGVSWQRRAVADLEAGAATLMHGGRS